MIFTQFVDEDLGCASYLIGDENSGIAAVVDPAYAIEQYVEEAERRAVGIVRVVETHTHADHVSGHGRLALELAVPVSIHPLAEAEYPHDSFADGDEIRLGDVVLRCIHTPGHRPEHCCIAVVDRARAEEPWLLLTGDSLFVGTVARPDLAVGAVEGAEGLFESLRRMLELPDGVEVYPGHVAGSLCGRAMSSKASTTIGFERRFNPALILDDRDAFVAESAAISDPQPPNLARIVELNRGPFLAAEPTPSELPVPPAGAQILDIRSVDEFAEGHLRGAVNVPVRGPAFATKAGFVLDPERPLVVAAAGEDDALAGVRGLWSIGFLDIAGYVLGEGAEKLELVSIEQLDELLAGGAELVDVREEDERETGYIAGSRNIPYRLLAVSDLDLPRDRPIVTACESGVRAAVAASVLAARGFDARPLVGGGFTDWERAGGPTVELRRGGSR